ncbi:hypothetical protein [Bacillus massiliigorillae]|uniref:hypothetical protein n=1 Tax=Bacillus massiliigorillae TaxID=1243664 RepID=UPI0003A510B2|nr:hypothetical protein [Bacillus massiliigorillae]
MQSTSIVQNLIPQQTASATNALKDGQMITGKVVKIHGNNTAEINIGQTKITAVIDAPITVGERYLFQVQNGGEVTSLKVVPSNGTNQSVKELAMQLLQHFSLTQTKESITLAQFFLKNELPLTKENFTQALQWVQSNGEVSKSLHIMKIMRDLSLPFSHDVFKAIAAFENKVPLSTLFSSLSQSVMNGESKTEVSLKAVLSQLLLSNVDKAAEKVLHKMLSTWLSSGGNVKDSMFRLLQEIGLFSKQTRPSDVLNQSLRLLNENNTIVQDPSIRNAVDLLVKMQTTTDANVVKPIQESFQQLVKNKILELSDNNKESGVWKQIQQELKVSIPNRSTINDLQNQPKTNAEQRKPVVENISTLGQNSYMKIAKHLLSYIMRTDQNIVRSHELLQLFAKAGKTLNSATNNLDQARQYIANQLLQAVEGRQESIIKYDSYDKQLLQTLIQEEVTALSASKSSIFASEMKSALRMLGVGFEHHLANLDQSTTIKESELLSLKPLLLKIINETQSMNVKDHAEQLLNKISAQQILSQASGPIQHIITQFPITFHQFQAEVTMQWSGRKKKDGVIDPAFCRVLFYLQLENIDETIIDLVVQNKVMKISVINERANILQNIAKSLMQQVKERLEAIGFKISSILFEQPNSMNHPALQIKRESAVYDTSPYSGVDIKI